MSSFSFRWVTSKSTSLQKLQNSAADQELLDGQQEVKFEDEFARQILPPIPIRSPKSKR
jgi:hypothetical protein